MRRWSQQWEASKTVDLPALDVLRDEPPPHDSPLWDMPNVILSPHSASTVTQENARITEIFCENLRRYLGGQPLRNVLDKKKLY